MPQTNLHFSASPGISRFAYLKYRIREKRGTGVRDVAFLVLNRDSVEADSASLVLGTS